MHALSQDNRRVVIRCNIIQNCASKNQEMQLLQTKIPHRRFESVEGWVCSWIDREVVPVPDGFREIGAGIR